MVENKDRYEWQGRSLLIWAPIAAMGGKAKPTDFDPYHEKTNLSIEQVAKRLKAKGI